MLIPKTKHALIKFCKLVLDTDQDITENDLDETREIISKLLHFDNLSPTDIKNKYNLEYTNFSVFLKTCLGVELKSVKDAVINYNRASGRASTNDTVIYRRACEFKFNIADYPQLVGYEQGRNVSSS